MPNRTAPIITLLLTTAILSAQSPTKPPPTFEVSTVKPSQPNGHPQNFDFGRDNFTMSNMPLWYVFIYAYNLNLFSHDQSRNAPPWMFTQRFDINAKVDADLAARLDKMSSDEHRANLRLLLQSLLADRFQLKVHTETREVTVYALVLTKGGPKLKPSPPEATNPTASPSPPSRPKWRGVRPTGTGQYTGHQATLDDLANTLARMPEFAGRLVVNKTGLTGQYDFTLNWTEENATVDNGPTLFTALQQQLGLKIELTKTPVDVVVIDHIEKPTEN